MKLSQEEEKAIEWFKEDLTKEKEEMEYYNEYKKQVIKRNEKLLNLIENQQKEIEELKETNEDNAEKSLLNDIFIKKNYISKDKIREKIKELEDNMILFTNDKEKFNRYKYARNILEELLEEN